MSAELAVKILAILLALLAGQAIAGGPDLARERRLADEIVELIFDGDATWLQAGGREFLSIYTEADAPRQAAVILLHGRGLHPDWVDTIQPLRVGLVEQGYTTLSLQMPVLAKGAKYYDYTSIFSDAHPRIEAGIQFLRAQGYEKVVLLAHSCGVHMAMDWVRLKSDNAIDAFIGLGMGATDYQQPMRQAFPLDRMRVPVLDLYGDLEYPAVIRMAPRRKAMIAAGHEKSQQRVMPGADHNFTDQGEPLVTAVAAWLHQLGI